MNPIRAAERLAANERSTAPFALDCCLRWRDQFSTCQACFHLRLGEAVRLEEPPVRVEGELAQCERCSPLFATEALCPPPEFRQRTPCGSLLRPHLQSSQPALDEWS